MHRKDDLYKNFYKLYKNIPAPKSGSESGIFPKGTKRVAQEKKISEINERINFLNNVLIGIILILGIAFIGFVIDALYFHINNSRYFENVYELKNGYEQRIDDAESKLNKMGTDFDKFKLDYPEFFK